MKENGNKIKGMEKGKYFIQMEQIMKGNGQKIKSTEKEY